MTNDKPFRILHVVKLVCMGLWIAIRAFAPCALMGYCVAGLMIGLSESPDVQNSILKNRIERLRVEQENRELQAELSRLEKGSANGPK